MLNRHFNLPLEYIDNNIIKISANKKRSHSDSESYHSGSGSLAHLVKHAITPKTDTRYKRLKHPQNGDRKEKTQSGHKNKKRVTGQNKIKWIV